MKTLSAFKVCLLLSLVAFGSAWAENWIPVMKTTTGATIYIDKDTFQRTDGVVEYWQRNDDKTTQLMLQNNACPIARKTARALFLTKEDCVTGETHVGIEFKSYDSKGNLLVYPPAGEPLKPISKVFSSSSAQGMLHRKLCHP